VKGHPVESSGENSFSAEFSWIKNHAVKNSARLKVIHFIWIKSQPEESPARLKSSSGEVKSHQIGSFTRLEVIQ